MICPKCKAIVSNIYAAEEDKCSACGADIFIFVDMIQELRRNVEAAEYKTHLRNVEISKLRIRIHNFQVTVEELEDAAHDEAYKRHIHEGD